ncbi:MAG: DNA/RNA helicase domain-containing protein [Candidatus Egerieousia sp.]
MIVYHASKKRFLEDVVNNTIADDIDNAFKAHLGRTTSPNEKLSWKNSMLPMYIVVNESQIPDDSTIAIEYQIPLTSKRIDFIISGLDDYKRPNIIIVELKQWEHAKLTGKSGIVQTRFQHGEAETVHPSYQAWSYAFMLENYNETVQREHIQLSPCAFLHNYKEDGVISNECYKEYIDKAPIFLKNDSAKLSEFIKSRIKYGSKNDIVWQIESGKLRPSKQLADSLDSMLKGNKEFQLLDEQKVVYETAMNLARAAAVGPKQVYIVEGGPGTGKSVLAVNLLVQLNKDGIVSQYVSTNAAPREVYCSKLTQSFKRSYVNNLFVGSGTFMNLERDAFGALIVDEAHRLNMKSGLFKNRGENQILEIINASRFSIFFVDDRQRIHVDDIGSKAVIQCLAETCGAIVHTAKLSSQFRCNGSDGYLSWLDNTLQIKETANINLSQDDYDFRIFSDPNELFRTIKRKNDINNKSRLVAGYCWDWKSKKDASAYDIEIPEFNFKKRWNLSQDGSLWIVAKGSIEEIGCIHTCQGLELDYVGVIIGADMRYEDGRIVTDVKQRSGKDSSIRGLKTRMKSGKDIQAFQEADEIIKNTYRTMLTRGAKGCYVYCCDKALADYLSSKLETKEERKQTYRVEESVNDEVKYVDFLPLYSLKAACGYFGDGELVEEIGWMKVDGLGKLNRNMFVVQAVGHSMEPIINDGDYCVFRANPAGSRQGKIVLAEHRTFDPDYDGSYSIKTYTSRKSFNDDGTWRHEEIVLQPRNHDYSPIIIEAEAADEFRIIGEFVGTLKPFES